MNQLHRECARAHAKIRATERLNTILSDGTIDAHESLIREGRATYLGRGYGERRLYGVSDAYSTFYAVFCDELDTIVTYLSDPSEWRGSYAFQGADQWREQHAERRP